MSLLPGVPLDTVRDQLSAADRTGWLASWARQSRRCISCRHRVIRDWWPADWPAFVAGQRAVCQRTARLSLPAPWADQIPRFPDGVELSSRPPVLLHTEVMRQHLLTAEGAEGGMAADRLRARYAPVFVAEGDSRLPARALTAIGYRRDQPGADLRCRLLAWGIMHRYSNLPWRMRRLPERRRAVAIYGPTSSGKTALSLDVCEAAAGRGLRPVVLNADSRQVYAGMDIGTRTIKPPQMRGF